MSDGVGEGKEFWDRRAAAWERRADELSEFSDTYGRAAIDALAPEPGERVLDVGCGPGVTTVELARRVGPDGTATGVDISEGMIGAARRRAEAADITNASFLVADAATADLGGPVDGIYSRFGVMFFGDPAAAFTNIVGALRPGGRLAWAVWGPLPDNPWMFVPSLAAAAPLQAELTIPEPGAPGPFSLADADQARALLVGAGLVDVSVTPVDGARVITAANADKDVAMVLEVGPFGEAYDAADDAARRAAIDAVLAAMESYREGDGWRLPGRSLTLTGRRPG